MNALVVIYNKPLSESLTIRSIKDAQAVDVFVADNSTSDFGNRVYALENGYRYFDMGGNKGLSKAYNRVISILEKNDDLVCLFDDDTKVDKAYFDVLRQDADRYKDIDIFVPIVKDVKGILSPCVFNGIRGKRIGRLEDIPANRLSFVNSGLAVRLKVFSDYQYDENQFLDYIDHAFAYDVIKHKKSRVHIMNVVLEQQFTGSGKASRKDEVRRFEIFKKDVKYFCGKYRISALRCRIFLFLRSARISIRRLFRSVGLI